MLMQNIDRVEAVSEQARLEGLPLDVLVAEYEQVLNDLLALDSVPARRDDAELQGRITALQNHAYDIHLEVARRTRFGRQMVERDAEDGDEPDSD